MIVQRRIVLGALVSLCVVFFGIRLDRSLIDQAPKAFMANTQRVVPTTTVPSAFLAITSPRQRARARRRGGVGGPDILTPPADPSFAPQPDFADGGDFGGPTGGSFQPAAFLPGSPGSGQFIGLPGSGGPGGGGVGGGLSPTSTPGGGGGGGVVIVPPPGDPNPGGGGGGGGTLPDPGPPAVPEPETWAMIILGLIVVGFAMRRRPLAGRIGGGLAA